MNSKMSNWTRMQTLELILLYEQHPILYNVKSEDFLDRIKKNDALAEISTALKALRSEVTPDEVKSKIKTIRSQYIRERNTVAKSKKSGAGTDEVYVPKLWCFEELQFLDKHIASTPQYSNIPKAIDESSSETSLLVDDADLSNNNNGGRRKRTTLDRQISRSLQIAEDMAESVRIRREKKPSPQYNLGKFVENELEGIADSLFFEVKWKIVKIIQEAQEKDIRLKTSLSETVLLPNLCEKSTSEASQASSSSCYLSRSNASHLEAVVPAKRIKSSSAGSETLHKSPHEPFNSAINQRRTIPNVVQVPKAISVVPVARNCQFTIKSTDRNHTITSSELAVGSEHFDGAFKPVANSSPIMKPTTFFIKNVKPHILNLDKAKTLPQPASSAIKSEQILTRTNLDSVLKPTQHLLIKKEKPQILNVTMIHPSNAHIYSAFEESNKK